MITTRKAETRTPPKPQRSAAPRRSGTPRRTAGGTKSVIDRYFDEIRHYPVLSREQECELARAAQAGCETSTKRLIECNLRFVVRVAVEYRDCGMPLEDLINEGNIGLMEAAERFDTERGVRFISWAVWWIRKSILKALSEQPKVVRLPNSQTRKVRLVRTIERDLEKQLGRVPSREEIQAELPDEWSPELDPIHRHGLRVSSIDEPIDSMEQDTLAETLEDTEAERSDDDLIAREATETVLRLHERLDGMQKTVINCRFGLDGSDPMTLAEIAGRIGRSREGVRFIERRALGEMRKLMYRETVSRIGGPVSAANLN